MTDTNPLTLKANTMEITNEQLTQVAALLDTTDRNTIITFTIGALIRNGFTAQQAIDAVFGNRAYAALADEVYRMLRGDADRS